MAVQYLVVSSGTQTLSQNALNYYGQSDWILVQVLQPEDSPILTYVFRK